MYNFCTLFDTHYISRGLTLYYSLEKNCEDFHVYIFAFDDKCFSILTQLQLKKATIISLKEFEDEELLRIKPSRSIGEYCWTSTSSTILFILEKYKVESCTYLDADLNFYSSPKPIFDELGDGSILLTEHRYSPEFVKSDFKKSGKYCVQFITFKNDERGLTALRWWRERCLEWCFAYYEDGKFGDQLYLEDWTERFEGVHVMQHLGGGLAGWNVQQYDFISKDGKYFGIEKTTQKEFEVIFYHFHYLLFYSNGDIELGRRYLSPEVHNYFYKPYIQQLEKAKEIIRNIDGSFDPHGSGKKPFLWKTPLLYVYRHLKGTYNIFNKLKYLEK
ncbi:MAG: glycosyl transferase [Ignavibacteriaceae bacterium]|jgi:hypothetical protein